MAEILPNRKVQLAQAHAIGAAETFVFDPYAAPSWGTLLSLEAQFLYGAAGTTAKAYVQTSLDAGVTWFDVAAFAFTTAAAKKVSALNRSIAPASQAFAPTDGTLADDTIVQGVLGDRVRVKLITTGTYTGATSVQVTGVFA